jgi:hypothetical protein
MSDNQRPPPSGPASQFQGYPQHQNGNNNHNRRTSNQARGSGQRGPSRTGRGRGSGRAGSAEHLTSERQSLAARISSGSTLQDRLS